MLKSSFLPVADLQLLHLGYPFGSESYAGSRLMYGGATETFGCMKSAVFARPLTRL
jgi:hypothetical protein